MRAGKDRLKQDLFPEVLVQDIIPFIEKKYRVKKDRQHRAMAGLSMGSVQTSMLLGKHPELFSWGGLFSGFLHNIIGEHPDNSHLETVRKPEFFPKHEPAVPRHGKAGRLLEEF